MTRRSQWVTAACLGILAGASSATGCNKGDSGSSAAPSATTPTAAGAKHACKGQNDCKGQGGCGTDKHACKGQNACKGQGGCKMS
jgi:hypothetical protein